MTPDELKQHLTEAHSIPAWAIAKVKSMRELTRMHHSATIIEADTHSTWALLTHARSVRSQIRREAHGHD